MTHIINFARSSQNPPENSDSGTGKKEKEKKTGKARTRKMVLCPAVRRPHPHQMRSVLLHMLRKKRRMMIGEDTTEEAQRRRMDEISDHAKVLTLSDDLERTVEERVNILFDFVKKKKEEGIIDSSDKEIVAEAERLDVKAMGPLVLTEVLLMRRLENKLRNTGAISYDFVTTTKKLNGTFFMVWSVW